jgi:hypothetical protein
VNRETKKTNWDCEIEKKGCSRGLASATRRKRRASLRKYCDLFSGRVSAMYHSNCMTGLCPQVEVGSKATIHKELDNDSSLTNVAINDPLTLTPAGNKKEVFLGVLHSSSPVVRRNQSLFFACGFVLRRRQVRTVAKQKGNESG